MYIHKRETGAKWAEKYVTNYELSFCTKVLIYPADKYIV